MKTKLDQKIQLTLKGKLPSTGSAILLVLCLTYLPTQQTRGLAFSQDGAPTSNVPVNQGNSTDAEPNSRDDLSPEPKIEVLSQPDAAPALNIVTSPTRPTIPPPPQDLDLPPVEAKLVPPEAWRVRANQLFKANTLDKNYLSRTILTCSYKPAMKALTDACLSQGFTVESSANAGHVLVTYRTVRDNRPIVEKAIFALRQTTKTQTDDNQFSSPTNDGSSSPQTGTEIRCFSDSKNKFLTVAKVREILSNMQGSATGLDPGQAY